MPVVPQSRRVQVLSCPSKPLQNTKQKKPWLKWFCQPVSAASLARSVLTQVCLLLLPLQLLQLLVCWQEVVFKVEVGEVLAVEQIWGQLLQAAAGQINRIDPLGHHLDERRWGEGGEFQRENKERKEKPGVKRGLSLLHKTLLVVFCLAAKGSNVVRWPIFLGIRE